MQTNYGGQKMKRFSIFLTNNDAEHFNISHQPIETLMQPIRDVTTKNHNWGIAYQNQMYMQSLPALPDIKPRKKLRDILENHIETESSPSVRAAWIEYFLEIKNRKIQL